MGEEGWKVGVGGNVLQKTWLVFVLLMIAELYLALYTGECASFLLCNRMRTVQNCIPRLYVQKRQLHRVATVDVLIGEEEFSS